MKAPYCLSYLPLFSRQPRLLLIESLMLRIARSLEEATTLFRRKIAGESTLEYWDVSLLPLIF